MNGIIRACRISRLHDHGFGQDGKGAWHPHGHGPGDGCPKHAGAVSGMPILELLEGLRAAYLEIEGWTGDDPVRVAG
ncbi:hypothetical protein ACK11Z_06050 [Methanoculleus bourgensis]|uniref:hypothetical protein n=1 Tax=Methanoculleus bourgensis TaxID=83986 RepID=UPI003B95313D